jgi:hypothetical protein
VSVLSEQVAEHRHRPKIPSGTVPRAVELLNLTEIGRYLNVSAERARQVALADPTFPAPLGEHPRRWSRAKVGRWAERHWWDTRP